MNNTARTSIIAVATFVVGGLLVYGYTAMRPLAVTTTKVAVNEPAGHAALTDTQAGIRHLNAADREISKGELNRAADDVAGAKLKFLDAAKKATVKSEPLLVAQEALIVHEFGPEKAFQAVGVATPDEADAADMVLTQGRKSRPMTLKDYSISFGDLSIDTNVVNSHLDKAYMAAKRGQKNLAANEVTAARDAITFVLTGDQLGEA